MIINFILPFISTKPVGGIKIVYEYANRLAKMGHDIVVYHSIENPYQAHPWYKPFIVRYIYHSIKVFISRFPSWFKFDKRVQIHVISKLKDDTIRDADATITTWWSLAYPLSLLSSNKGVKVNLIQGYEVWNGNTDLVHASYMLTNKNIVVSEYLKEVVDKYSPTPSIVIDNAIDHDVFSITRPIETREPASICMLYSHQDEIKGTSYGLKALKNLKEKEPSISVDLFSVYPRPKDLPAWITFNHNPSNLCEIYNRNSIFISPSINEGWGLPCAEAMQCGCAVICTDIPGHKQFIENESCLTVVPKSSVDIEEKVLMLLEDRKLRMLVATKGSNLARKFSWKRNLDMLLNVILLDTNYK